MNRHIPESPRATFTQDHILALQEKVQREGQTAFTYHARHKASGLEVFAYAPDRPFTVFESFRAEGNPLDFVVTDGKSLVRFRASSFHKTFERFQN